MDLASGCERVKPVLLEYLMQEVSAGERREIELHVESCEVCSREMEELRRTLSLVARTERSEEIPRHIRMVAEPSARWADFWRYPARLAFASAAMLCLAVALLALFHTTISYHRGSFEIAFGAPSARIGPPIAAATEISAAETHTSLQPAQVSRMISDAVAASEARRQRESERMVQEVSQHMEQRWQHDLAEMAGSLRYFQAAQTMLYKGQVQSEQLVSALMQHSAGAAPRQ